MNIATHAPVTTKPLAIHFDEDGFLYDTESWNTEMAQTIANLDGLGSLTKKHFLIIDYLRSHYLQYGSLPVMSHVCRVNHLKKTAIKELFGSCRQVWRIAGLPNPGEEAKTYM